MVSFRPLGNAKLRAFQCIVTLDVSDVNVLIDTGWDEMLSQETLTDLIAAIPSIDLILLTHATIGHTGAFCYLRHKFPEFRAIPAYATLPVIRMSQMMTLEIYRNAGICGPFDNPDSMNAEDVEAIWSEVNNVKYSQPLKLHKNPKLEGTTITAYNGGHSLGGSLWKIYDGIDSVVVALDWNHARDAHLNGAFLEPKTGVVVGDLQKPSLLITSSNVSSGQTLTKARQLFLQNIDAALKLQGTVLIPTSSGSRVLELILILEKHMSTHHKDVPLIYCNRFGKQTLTQASSMLEWMVPSIIGDWQVQNESPFDTTNVHYVPDLPALRQSWGIGPKVVLAAGECLESGPSKELFLDFIAEDANSTVIINELCPSGTLGETLIKSMKSSEFSQLNMKLAKIEYNSAEPLTGDALAAYSKKRETEREYAVITAAQERRNQQLIDTSAQAVEESSESEEDEDFDPTCVGSNVLIYGKDIYDYECPRNGVTQDREEGNADSTATNGSAMFPTSSKRRRADEYGEFIPSGLFDEKSKSSQEKSNSNVNPDAAAGDQDMVDANDNIASADDNAGNTLVQGEEELPVTLVKATRKNVNVVCWIAYADMNGLTNARSLQMVLKQVQPARIIALPGSDEVCSQLAKQYQVFDIGDKQIQFERTNFSVDVRLDPSMSLEWHNLIGGYSVARVAGTLQFDPHDRIKKSGAVLVSSTSSDKETSDASEPGKIKSIAIGDLRLTSLRKVLNEEGMQAEFRGQGILVCNDKVVVRKTGNGSYILQGGIDEDYYKVRSAIRQFVTTI